MIDNTRSTLVAGRKPSRGAARGWLPMLLVPLVVSGWGCTRAFYRQQADDQAYALVRQKADDPRWSLPNYTIQVSPESRMFDPFNPDREPMPPDDPASHQLMHCVDEKRGYPHWHANGDVTEVASPFWKSYLMVNEDGVLVLDRNRAVQLALLNSPTFQQELEDLYLSALDVSSERFRFDVQLFGPSGLNYQTTGREAPLVSAADLRRPSRVSTSRLAVDSFGRPTGGAFRLERAFTTGSELMVGVANNLVWDLSGNTTNFTNTLLDFTFIQPMLRGAGRERIMETLTRSERTLLANVRQMERYRRGFYVEITTGRSAGQGPVRAGGFFGASGLGGFTGVGGGGFGGVGGAAGGGGFTGGGGGTGAGATSAGGFIGILQDQQNIRNQQANITGLRENLVGLREVLQENLLQIPVDGAGAPDPTVIVRNRLQIAQARQALFSAEGQLLNQQNGYQATLDAFKFTMGLPPRLCMKVEDPLLDQFNLIDPELGALRDRVSDLRTTIGLINEQILAAVQLGEQGGQVVPGLPWSEELRTNLAALRANVDNIQSVRRQLMERGLVLARQDVDKLDQALPARREQLAKLRNKYLNMLDDQQYQRQVNCQLRLPVDVDPSVFDARRLDALADAMRSELDRLDAEVKGYEEPLQTLTQTLDDVLRANPKPGPDEVFRRLQAGVVLMIPSILAQLGDNVLDTSLVQARSRADTIDLTEIDLSSQQAFEIARNNRRDWMNQRAQLVDQWRLIEFNANNLEGIANLVVEGDVANKGQNPIKLRSTRGHLRLGLQFDAPYTRLQERNTYRQSLIEFQQARRSYYRYVDQVSQGLRGTIRQIELNQLNFEARRVALLASIEQVVLNSEIQTLTEERGQQQSPTAARDIISALGDFRNAQNDFLSVWVNYDVLRRTLDFDLGTMQLDEQGLWIDPGKMGPDYGSNLQYADNACPDLIMAPFLSSPLDGNDFLDDGSLGEESLGEGSKLEVLPPGVSESGEPLPLPGAEPDLRQELQQELRPALPDQSEQSEQPEQSLPQELPLEIPLEIPLDGVDEPEGTGSVPAVSPTQAEGPLLQIDYEMPIDTSSESTNRPMAPFPNDDPLANDDPLELRGAPPSPWVPKVGASKLSAPGTAATTSKSPGKSDRNLDGRNGLNSQATDNPPVSRETTILRFRR